MHNDNGWDSQAPPPFGLESGRGEEGEGVGGGGAQILRGSRVQWIRVEGGGVADLDLRVGFPPPPSCSAPLPRPPVTQSRSRVWKHCLTQYSTELTHLSLALKTPSHLSHTRTNTHRPLAFSPVSRSHTRTHTHRTNVHSFTTKKRLIVGQTLVKCSA